MIPSFPFGAILAYFQVQQAAKMSFGESNHPMIHVILGGWCFTPSDNEHRCVGKENDLPTKTSPFLGFKSREIFPGFSIPVYRYTYNFNIQCSYKAILEFNMLVLGIFFSTATAMQPFRPSCFDTCLEVEVFGHVQIGEITILASITSIWDVPFAGPEPWNSCFIVVVGVLYAEEGWCGFCYFWNFH